MKAHFRAAREKGARAWCRLMHSETSWPMNGYYRCAQCHRAYRVPWDEPLPMAAAEKTKPQSGLEPAPAPATAH